MDTKAVISERGQKDKTIEANYRKMNGADLVFSWVAVLCSVKSWRRGFPVTSPNAADADWKPLAFCYRAHEETKQCIHVRLPGLTCYSFGLLSVFTQIKDCL